jgi:type IV pilus assembly protein PilB
MSAEALLKEGFMESEVSAGIKVYKPMGCGSCTDGYKGRTGLYQVMPVSDEIQRIILQDGNAVDIAQQSATEGIWDLRRSGLEKVKSGMTSLDEVNQCTTE